MSKVNVGLLGFGLAGSVFHAPLIQSCDAMELKAIGSRSFSDKCVPHGVKAAGFDEVIQDPSIDLIVVATPNTSHFPQAFAALQAGKHVVLDKPMTIRASEAEALINLAQAKGLVLSLFQNRRWDGGFRTARKLLGEGGLGTLSFAEFHYDRHNPNVKDRWREEPIPGAGVLYDLGPHLIDQAYCLFGMPNSVFADVVVQRPGAVVDDYFHLVLDYGRLRVVLHASNLVSNFGPRIALYGDKASFQQFGLDGQEDDLKNGLRPGDPNWGITKGVYGQLLAHDGAATKIDVLKGAYEMYYAGIADAISNGTPPPVLPSDARDTMSILEAAVRSGREKRVVAMI